MQFIQPTGTYSNLTSSIIAGFLYKYNVIFSSFRDVFFLFFCLCKLKRILASGSCQIDKAIEELDGAEAYDTAMVMVEYPGGKTAVIDVCRQAPYGWVLS